jgi:hypothetical protein
MICPFRQISNHSFAEPVDELSKEAASTHPASPVVGLEDLIFSRAGIAATNFEALDLHRRFLQHWRVRLK